MATARPLTAATSAAPSVSTRARSTTTPARDCEVLRVISSRPSAEDADGRLEMTLSTSQSRAGVVVERALVLTLGAALVAAVSGLAVAIAAHYQAMSVSAERLTEGTLLLVPFALVFAAAGAVLASWNPRAAVGLLGGLAFASYLVDELGPLFRL